MINFENEKIEIIKKIKQSKLFDEIDLELKESDPKKYIISLIKKNGWVTSLLSKNLLNNKKFILEVIKKQYLVYKYLNEELKNDTDVALLWVKGFVNSNKVNSMHFPYDFLGEKIKNDSNFILKIMKEFNLSVWIKDHISETYFPENWNGFEEYLSLLDLFNIKFSFSWKIDFKNINKNALLKKMDELQFPYLIMLFCSVKLRNEKKFISNLIVKNADCFLFSDLNKERKFIIKEMKKNIDILKNIDDELKTDSAFIL